MFKLVVQGFVDKDYMWTKGDTREYQVTHGIKCVCLNARSIINKKTKLNIMVDDRKPHDMCN